MRVINHLVLLGTVLISDSVFVKKRSKSAEKRAHDESSLYRRLHSRSQSSTRVKLEVQDDTAVASDFGATGGGLGSGSTSPIPFLRDHMVKQMNSLYEMMDAAVPKEQILFISLDIYDPNGGNGVAMQAEGEFSKVKVYGANADFPTDTQAAPVAYRTYQLLLDIQNEKYFSTAAEYVDFLHSRKTTDEGPSVSSKYIWKEIGKSRGDKGATDIVGTNTSFQQLLTDLMWGYFFLVQESVVTYAGHCGVEARATGLSHGKLRIYNELPRSKPHLQELKRLVEEWHAAFADEKKGETAKERDEARKLQEKKGLKMLERDPDRSDRSDRDLFLDRYIRRVHPLFGPYWHTDGYEDFRFAAVFEPTTRKIQEPDREIGTVFRFPDVADNSRDEKCRRARNLWTDGKFQDHHVMPNEEGVFFSAQNTWHREPQGFGLRRIFLLHEFEWK